MPKPPRRSSLGKAPRAVGEYAIATPTRTKTAATLGATALQDVPATEVEVDSESVPTVQDACITAPSRPAPLTQVPPLGEWDFTREGLLNGQKEPTNIIVDTLIAGSIRRIRTDLRIQGLRIMQGTLVAEALAFAYLHHQEWTDQVHADGRRERHQRGEHPRSRRRTSFMLPVGLSTAAEVMVWRSADDDDAVIPSIAGLQTTALRWGLDQQQRWLPARIAEWTKNTSTL